MKFLSVEKRCPVTIFFIYISIATMISSRVTSSKLDDENSAKAWYSDETHSYRF